MKVKVFMRVARYSGRKTPQYKVAANITPNFKPLESASGAALPTAAFALELDLPDAAFRRAEQVLAQISVSEEAIRTAADVKVLHDSA